jgi:hypothetical protein
VQSSTNAKPNSVSSLKDSFTPSDKIYVMDTTNKTHIIWSNFEYSLTNFPIHYILYSQAQQGGIIFGFTMLGIVVGFIFTFCSVKKCCPKRRTGRGAEPPELETE